MPTDVDYLMVIILFVPNWPFFTTTLCTIFWYFVIIILYCKMIHPVILFQQHTFYIVYILLYNTILNWFSLTLQLLNIDFFRMLNIFFRNCTPVSGILLLLYLKKKQHQEHRWFQSYSEKKNLQQNKGTMYTVNKIVIFIEIFLGIPDFFNFILV